MNQDAKETQRAPDAGTAKFSAAVSASPSVIKATGAMNVHTNISEADISEVGQRARRRIAWRLLPFLFILYFIAYLDRVNVGFAGLEMSHNLGFTDRVFGLGAGIFFAGYFLFEIPGALIVERWSARKWIARILITWGLVTILVSMIHTPMQFYGARFLLGLAEAGFFPGIIVYLTRWLGLPGWRWLFILEGIPAVLLGIVTLVYLTDWPRQARWLPADEQEWIMGELDREKRA